MIFPKQSIEDEFCLSHLENQTNLEVKWIMEDTNIQTHVTEEETISEYHATGILPK